MSALVLLDTHAFAERCGVRAATVRRWVKKGQVTPWGYTPGGHMRFTADQVVEAIRRGMSERARDIEAHVLAARAALRMRRGRSA